MRITGSDVDALFNGEAVTLPSRASTSPGDRDYRALYTRCHRCRQVTVGLLSFDGNKDWSDHLGEAPEIRKAVNLLRKEFNRQMINLCQWCIAEMQEAVNDAADETQEVPEALTLF